MIDDPIVLVIGDEQREHLAALSRVLRERGIVLETRHVPYQQRTSSARAPSVIIDDIPIRWVTPAPGPQVFIGRDMEITQTPLGPDRLAPFVKRTQPAPPSFRTRYLGLCCLIATARRFR